MKFKSKLIGLAASAALLAAPLSQAATSVWKVSKGDDYIYVGGTVHILPQSEFPLPEAFDKAYQSTQSIVLEADLPADDDVQAQIAMMQRVSYSDGRTLKSVLDDNAYQALAQYLAGFGANIEMVNNFKPGMVSTMMTVMEAQKAQMGDKGVDVYYDKLASKDQKLAEYLETVEFQLDMIAGLGEGYESKFVTMAIEQVSDFKPMMTSLIQAWRKGDAKTMVELVHEPVLAEDPTMYKAVFTDRNLNWIPKLEGLFGDQDKEFVLVGVGHLVGKDNVLSLLTNKGYKVEQL